MRARNIKPGFFKNELLGTYDPIITLTFEGLWLLADREGILEDRPLRIKAELFPYRENLDVNGYLTVLERDNFILRYEVNGKRYILVHNFADHQKPHHTEKSRNFPKPIKYSEANHHDTCKDVLTPLNNGEHQVASRSDSLIHGFTDSGDSKQHSDSDRGGARVDADDGDGNDGGTPTGDLVCKLRRAKIACAGDDPRLANWRKNGVDGERLGQVIETALNRRAAAGSTMPVNMGLLDAILQDPPRLARSPPRMRVVNERSAWAGRACPVLTSLQGGYLDAERGVKSA